MKILVTGAAGFIGSHVCERALTLGHEVIGVDNFDPFYARGIKEANVEALAGKGGSFTLLEADIRDPGLGGILAEHQDSDAVVHLAGLSDVRESMDRAADYFRTNVDGTVNVLEFARQAKVHKFLFASSCMVYGNSGQVPFSESDPAVLPATPYAASKRSGELLCHAYHHLYGIAATCLRFFSVYGPRQRPEMAIRKFARLISTGGVIPLYGGGRLVRDYAYVGDIVDGIFLALERAGGFRIYNVGNSRPHSTLDIIGVLEQALGAKAVTRDLPVGPGDAKVSFASIDLARTELGYEPKIGLEDGLKLFANWYLSQGAKIQLALDRDDES